MLGLVHEMVRGHLCYSGESDFSGYRDHIPFQLPFSALKQLVLAGVRRHALRRFEPISHRSFRAPGS